MKLLLSSVLSTVLVFCVVGYAEDYDRKIRINVAYCNHTALNDE